MGLVLLSKRLRSKGVGKQGVGGRPSGRGRDGLRVTIYAMTMNKTIRCRGSNCLMGIKFI